MQTERLVDLAFRDAPQVMNLPAAETAGPAYRDAKPYPYLVMDNFLEKSVTDEITREIASTPANHSVVFNDSVQKNKSISTGKDVPKYISLLAAKFASAEFLRYLEKVTGLEGLIPDPYYNTEYGYYHVVGPGGVLGSHLDHSHHQTLQLPHVLNLVIYLSDGWNDQDGGALCLFDETGKKVMKRVECKFNRAALFAANPISYHGVEPIKETAGRKRHSIYFAYYSVKQDPVEVMDTFPELSAKGATNKSVKYGTYFVVPWYQLLAPRNRNHLKMRLWNFAKLLCPPLLVIYSKKLIKRQA